jgi:alginate O-acetyltransferase complex protein AlgI
MTFTSFGFLIFFPAVILVYYCLPGKYRGWFLLLASYYFYINLKPVYALLLAGITLTTYAFTILMGKGKVGEKQKIIAGPRYSYNAVTIIFF